MNKIPGQELTAADLLTQKHDAEKRILQWQQDLVNERQACEKRITVIDAELKASGWVKPRKPRQKKASV